VADVSWTVHNAGSRAFVDSFVADNGGHVERAFAAELDVERQFDFHERDRQAVDVEVFRVVWSGDPDRGDAGE
jgi:putative methylase